MKMIFLDFYQMENNDMIYFSVKKLFLKKADYLKPPFYIFAIKYRFVFPSRHADRFCRVCKG